MTDAGHIPTSVLDRSPNMCRNEWAMLFSYWVNADCEVVVDPDDRTELSIWNNTTGAWLSQDTIDDLVQRHLDYAAEMD